MFQELQDSDEEEGGDRRQGGKRMDQDRRMFGRMIGELGNRSDNTTHSETLRKGPLSSFIHCT